MQAKLLCVLQEGTVERLGSSAVRRVDARVIAATHRDLTGMVEAGSFRADLYYRLAVFPIPLPPVRDRREDVPALARHAVDRFARRAGRTIELTTAAVARLQAYGWPGNVRELQNVIERAVLLARGDVLDEDAFDDLPATAGSAVAPAGPPTGEVVPLEEVVARAERAAIVAALAATGDNKTRAAERLGVSVRTLWYKLRRLGIATSGAPE
jgi:transcriptional regulator with GAF, ATPase, and Fis domain